MYKEHILNRIYPGDVLHPTGISSRGAVPPKTGNYKMTFNFNAGLFKVVLDYLKPQTGERILDMGCSRGFYVRAIASYTDNIIGIDISESSLEEPVSDKVQYGDVTHLNFPPNSFDKIYSLHTIEHIPNPGRFLSEIDRVLKPGGIAIVVYPWELIRGTQAIGAALRQYHNPLMARKMHLYKLSPEKITRLIRNTSLCYVKSQFVRSLGFQYVTLLRKKPLG
ncbi:MAG: class I SAM-dependent methyltransferase [Dehalococcoidales bacterium]|nr:class I SAM-dependent methyltransferase [Dehalococcoidales bacterium]